MAISQNLLIFPELHHNFLKNYLEDTNLSKYVMTFRLGDNKKEKCL